MAAGAILSVHVLSRIGPLSGHRYVLAGEMATFTPDGRRGRAEVGDFFNPSANDRLLSYGKERYALILFRTGWLLQLLVARHGKLGEPGVQKQNCAELTMPCEDASAIRRWSCISSSARESESI